MIAQSDIHLYTLANVEVEWAGDVFASLPENVEVDAVLFWLPRNPKKAVVVLALL